MKVSLEHIASVTSPILPPAYLSVLPPHPSRCLVLCSCSPAAAAAALAALPASSTRCLERATAEGIPVRPAAAAAALAARRLAEVARLRSPQHLPF